jgi:hypothetical protein
MLLGITNVALKSEFSDSVIEQIVISELMENLFILRIGFKAR